MLFEAFIPQGWRLDLPSKPPGQQLELIIAVAKEVERLGFNCGWLFDHFITHPIPTNESSFECWTLLSALARETKSLRLGTMVTCNSYRYPSLLAKMACTFDVLSNGRLELGLGAGWLQREYDAYGIPFPSAHIRIRMLEEGVKIIRLMMTEDKPSFHGRYYSIREAINSPKPIQKPCPPITIGGRGTMTLRVAAKHADKCNLGGGAWTLEELRERFRLLSRLCDEEGRGGIVERSVMRTVIIADDRKEVEDKVKRFKPPELSEDEFRRMAIVGKPQEVASELEKIEKMGVRYFIGFFPDSYELDPLRLFAKEVIPLFRG